MTSSEEGVRMIVVDVIVVLILVGALVAGARRGFVASLGTILGLLGGGLVAIWVTPLVASWVPSLTWRGFAVLATALGLLIAGATLGGLIGAAIRSGVDKTPLRVPDRILGSLAGLLVTAVVLLAVAPGITITGVPAVSSAIASSRVLGLLHSLTPAPVSAALAQLRSSVLDDGLPRFGDLLGPGIGPSEPPVALDDPELERAAASVARVSGVAYACGTGMTGSGFVVATDRVVTNAHVVAGVDTPLVELPGRDAREGRVVYFDPIDDLAVIAVDGLQADPLPLSGRLAPGTAAVVQGYPYGGPFSMIPAGVLSAGTVAIPDIYGERTTPRDIYSLESEVRPGNSGGPLLTADGEVAGVVFARGETDQRRGYAMTNLEFEPVAASAPGLTDAVTPGRCTT